MLLKRFFIDGNLDYVKVLRHSNIQKFTDRFLDKCKAENIVEVFDDKFVFNTVPPLTYLIVRKPGWYCCFDDASMVTSKQAQEYVKQNYSGQQSPDPQNPAGYRKDSFYYCELEG